MSSTIRIVAATIVLNYGGIWTEKGFHAWEQSIIKVTNNDSSNTSSMNNQMNGNKREKPMGALSVEIYDGELPPSTRRIEMPLLV